MQRGQKAAIIGGGIIGRSWAVVFARAGLEVAIWDRAGAGAEAVLGPIRAILAPLEEAQLVQAAAVMGRIAVHCELRAVLADADYVQESVLERPELKREILGRIEAEGPREAIIGSSTSGLAPSMLAEALDGKGRFLVVHPLTPPHLLPLTELVPSRFTAEETVMRTEALMRRIGQHPIRIQAEVSGFAANRILAAMLNEFFLLIRDGVLRAEDADAVLTQGFGLRWACMGPFAAMDLNAAGGIGEYLQRYGYIFRAVAEERGAAPALDERVIADLAAAFRAKFPLSAQGARAARRDRAVAELKHLRKLAE